MGILEIVSASEILPKLTFHRFDNFGPLGPAIASPKVQYFVKPALIPEVVPNPGALVLQTRVNGELRQDTNTSDMLFDVPTLIAFLSQGTTLEAGSIIMTGTPEGNARHLTC